MSTYHLPHLRFRSLAIAAVTVGSFLLAGDGPGRSTVSGADPFAVRQAALVKYEPLPSACVAPPPLRQHRGGPTAVSGTGGTISDPVRTVKDPYPSFASVAVDLQRDEVVFTDESLFQVLVYDRLENTPEEVEASRPKRAIAGEQTTIEFQSGVYVDQTTGEIYAVNNDTRDTTLVFPHGAQGDVVPERSIRTPHGSFGIAVVEAQKEVMLTIQHDAAVVTYRKSAGGNEEPIRVLQGERTRLADPHGIAYDPGEDLVFVANFGSRARRAPSSGRGRHAGKANWPVSQDDAIPGSGTISPPSVTVHRRAASGDEPPVRVIEGPAAQLNWPTGVAFDPDRRELYISNDMGNSFLVFDAKANGNTAPKRVLKGPRTGLENPTGIALDLKNQELWVANFGGHSATVYDLTAAGDTAPRRAIRNAPRGAPSLMIGNPGAVAFDTKREEILVPN